MPALLCCCADLAKAMLQYEKACYETWRSTAEQIATSSLQQPVLAKEQPPEDAYSSAGAGAGQPVACHCSAALANGDGGHNGLGQSGQHLFYRTTKQ